MKWIAKQEKGGLLQQVEACTNMGGGGGVIDVLWEKHLEAHVTSV